ncbi:glycosyltransferase family 2 protein [Bacillus mycoides]|nr:glycosyltransferase family 2 protein [Bacillus mycoides]
MKPIVSVIVPIYNVERYINRCIKSVLGQTYENFELLLVDDGSSDNSGKICDEYAKRDNRIIVKHISNSGVSNARNLGIKYATGEWLLFLDGDDILEFNTIEIICKNIREHKDMDMLIGSFKYNIAHDIVCANNEDSYKKGIDIVREYGLWKVKTCMGAFAVKKEIIDKNNISFHITTKYGEDVEFINYCLVNSCKVKLTAEYFLNYMIHNESAVAKVSFDRYDCYESRARTLEYIQHKFPSYKDIDLLYHSYLLPEAIIDTTYLLCRSGVNIFKIIEYLTKKNYYSVIESVKENENTPIHIRKRINKFLDNAILTWGECFLSTQYYHMRGKLGLIKRKVFT